MKVIKLNKSHKQTATEKFISAILKTDINTFKATSFQFLKNNNIYNTQLTGIVA